MYYKTIFFFSLTTHSGGNFTQPYAESMINLYSFPCVGTSLYFICVKLCSQRHLNKSSNFFIPKNNYTSKNATDPVLRPFRMSCLGIKNVIIHSIIKLQIYIEFNDCVLNKIQHSICYMNITYL